MDSCTMLKRMGDKADFEKVDPQQLASGFAACCFARTVPEAETRNLALPQQLGGKAIFAVNARDNAQAAIVLCNALDNADVLIGPMLPQERQGLVKAGDCRAKGAFSYRVAISVRNVEQASVTGEADI